MTRHDEAWRVLGVDPGLNITGYGVLEVHSRQQLSVLEAGVIRGASRQLGKRLLNLHRGLRDVIEAFAPQVMALEELYSHYQRPRTAILMGHARGVLCLAASEAGIPVCPYSATQVKRVLTGNGRAPKSQMQQSVTRQLGLPDVPQPPDVADALAIAICHVFLGQSPAPLPPAGAE